MKIIVLDYDNLLAPRESWDIFSTLGDIQLFSAEESAAEAIPEADVILSVSARLNAAAIRSAKRLRYIGVVGADCSRIDTHTAAQLQVPISALPDAYAMIQVQYALKSVFSACADPFRAVSGLTVGAVGGGLAGRTFLEVMAKLGARTLLHEHAFNMAYHKGVHHYVFHADRFLSQCDLIAVFRPSLPLPGAPLTMRGVFGVTDLRNYLNAEKLSYVKDDAILIDTYPGVVEKTAVSAAVRQGKGLRYFDTMVPQDAQTDSQLIICACESLRKHMSGIGEYIW